MSGELGGRRGVPTLAWITASLCVALTALVACPGTAAAQSPPYHASGLRWIGAAKGCVAPSTWTAERVFQGIQLPRPLAELCLYIWRDGQPPTPAQVAALFSGSAARDLVEDVPVVFPTAPFSPQEQAFFTGLRNALHAQVGTAALLPSAPEARAARVVVIDSAPDATSGHIGTSASRHGETLAHLIEDIVCVTGVEVRSCAAEVTTALALPWVARGVLGPNGGYVGTLSDVARAIARAVRTWQADRTAAPSTTPERLILNLSLAWEHTASIAECTTAPLEMLTPPERAVRGILQYATARGALVIAAAGNDAGGPQPPSGLACPGRYQAVGQDTNPAQPLVVAVSGVDYQDRALETVRPLGVTGIVALGLGGVAWGATDPAPPQLIGTSVSTAVVSAIAALVWEQRTTATPGEVVKTIYDGGVDVGGADQCPVSLPGCRSHRASLCGALHALGVATTCSVPPAKQWSCPFLRAELAALVAAYSAGPRSVGTVGPASNLPRYLAPSVGLDPSVFPAPIAATCPTCVVASAAMSVSPVLVLPRLAQDLDDATLVVRLTDGTSHALQLGFVDSGIAPYVFPLPRTWVVLSAYLTGFDQNSYSVTEQIFVQP